MPGLTSDKEKALLEEARADAQKNGFFLSPDDALLEDLIAGLATNHERYGYPSCPCRIASGKKTYDADIICPCEYRDADCYEFGSCFCGLFISRAVYENPSTFRSIPERRPKEITELSLKQKEGQTSDVFASASQSSSAKVGKKIQVWRCTVCGYLAARETPPAICPICKAKAKRFERFDFG
jgi:ferredoxin-thioredoxin reductase catalytic chain